MQYRIIKLTGRGLTFWQSSARTEPSTYITFSSVNASLYCLRYLQHRVCMTQHSQRPTWLTQQCSPQDIIQGMMGGHNLSMACGHITAFGLFPFPHQRKICAEGSQGRHALSILGRTLLSGQKYHKASIGYRFIHVVCVRAHVHDFQNIVLQNLFLLNLHSFADLLTSMKHFIMSASFPLGKVPPKQRYAGCVRFTSKRMTSLRRTGLSPQPIRIGIKSYNIILSHKLHAPVP